MNVDRLSHILKGPLQICIDITNRCNLRCLHCFNRSGEDLEGRFELELTEAELLRLADDVREMQPQNLCLCGGEPLLRKHTVIAFLRQLRNGRTHPSMVTNGCLLDRETAWSLRQAGLESVQVSIDGADAATHERMRGVAGCYDRAIRAFHTARETGFKALSVAFSPTRFNFQQVSVVIEQFCQRGLTEFRVQPLMKLGRGGLSPEMFLNAPEYRNLVHDLARARLKHPGIKFEWGDPVEHLIRFSRGMDFVLYLHSGQWRHLSFRLSSPCNRKYQKAYAEGILGGTDMGHLADSLVSGFGFTLRIDIGFVPNGCSFPSGTFRGIGLL